MDRYGARRSRPEIRPPRRPGRRSPSKAGGEILSQDQSPHDRAWRDGMSPPRPQGVGEGTAAEPGLVPHEVGEGTAAEPGLVPHEVGEGTAAEGGGRGWSSPPCQASLKGSVPHDRREWGKVPPPKAGVGGGSVPHAKRARKDQSPMRSMGEGTAAEGGGRGCVERIRFLRRFLADNSSNRTGRGNTVAPCG